MTGGIWFTSDRCSVDECENRVRAKGLCNAHRLRLYRNGTLDKKAPLPAEDRFWRQVEVGLCWQWTGSLASRGYGSFRDGTTHRAHRYAWELLVGPIPKGMVLDHLCRNKGCVNPDHLEPVTQQENVRRGALSAIQSIRMRGNKLNDLKRR